MDFQQLKYFQTVARLEHMTRAAQELYVAQPSLSRAIARLEEELGAPLFDRQGRHIRLNILGKTFLQHVEKAFAELEKGQREVADLAGIERGQIGVAVLYTVGAQLLPELLHAFRKEHPGVRFQLYQNAAHIMAGQLEQGEIDMCITSPRPERSDIAWTPLMTEEIVLIVPPDHRLANRESVSLHEVSEEDFIAMKRSHGLREMTDQFCRQAGFQPRITFEGDELAIVRGLVAAGLGIAMIPALALRGIPEPAMIPLHISDIPCQRTIGLAWMQDRYQTTAMRIFHDFVISYFEHIRP